MPSSISDINDLLDNLYLELLNLIEQHATCRVNIEKMTNSGQLLLAKTRYNQGSKSISVAQIPTENSEDFNALCLVEEQKNLDNISGVQRSLIRNTTNKADGYVEPMNWFSVLPAMSLRNAADCFKKSIDLIVESANIQTEMLAVMDSIDHLKLLKSQT